MSRVRRTPKVFQSSYRPPQTSAPVNYRALRPLFWVIGAVVALMLLSRLPVFTVKTVSITGTDKSEILTKLQTITGRSVFSRYIGVTVDEVLASDLSIKTIDCRRGVPDTVRCQVTLRSPAVVWRHLDTSYAVDDHGLVYGTGGDGVLLDDRGTTAVTIGKTVASADSIAAYQQIHRGLVDRGYAVTNLFISESLYQVGVVVGGNSKPEFGWTPPGPVNILMITSYPISSQLSALDELVKTKKEKISQLVDLRSPGYAFVK